jgi:UDP-N-acetylglucosamine--N-acetylmuramyl-(pentapeptide) pyrophosphoryl-undecaprenol N-acetylglucosamine transferase
LLKELKPDAVMGGGGYVAGPVGLAAVTLRIPLVLTEADSHLGLTNRVLARGARRVCLAFPLAGRDGPRYRVTGRPVPPPPADRAGARERLGLDAGRDCLLVFGGSLGARSINMAAVEAFAYATSTDATSTDATSTDATSTDATSTDATSEDATAPSATLPDGSPTPVASTYSAATGTPATRTAFDVLHVAGRRDYPELSALVDLRSALPEGYDLREYLELEQFGDALAAADLVVARAGGSVFEIAASGTPAILVPYPHASADHQTENARWMESAGAAIVILDRELDAPRLAREVTGLLADRERLVAMASASRGLARPHAAGDIAEELLEAART